MPGCGWSRGEERSLHYANLGRSASHECHDRLSALAGDLRSRGKGLSLRTVRWCTAPLPLYSMIALVVPLALLLVAIRRNSGVFAAFLLLLLFAARM